MLLPFVCIVVEDRVENSKKRNGKRRIINCGAFTRLTEAERSDMLLTLATADLQRNVDKQTNKQNVNLFFLVDIDACHRCAYDDAARGSDGDDVATTAGAATDIDDDDDAMLPPIDVDVDDVAFDDDDDDDDEEANATAAESDDDDVAFGSSTARGDDERAVRGDDASTTIVTLAVPHVDRRRQDSARR